MANTAVRSLAFGLVLLFAISPGSCAEEADNSAVHVLKKDNFDQFVKDHPSALIEFYAPWCGHCKKLAPEWEKAAQKLKEKGIRIPLAKVDATAETDLAGKYNVKGYPTIHWFVDGKEHEYDGSRTADSIVDWVQSMSGPAVTETNNVPEPAGGKPNIILTGPIMTDGFHAAAKSGRRQANYFFQRAAEQKLRLHHQYEEQIEMTEGFEEKEKILAFYRDNSFPLFGQIDGETYPKYMEKGVGMIWGLFDMADGMTAQELGAKHRSMMTEVAKKWKSKYYVVFVDTTKFKDPLKDMMGITTFPQVVVHKKAGDKKKYMMPDQGGDYSAAKINQFVEQVEAGLVFFKLKSEKAPEANEDPVRVVVGDTMEKELFLEDKDVMLEIYAPWCGHCKKLAPEYQKVAMKVKKEGVQDLLVLAKLDGTQNDSPLDDVDWGSGFPTIVYAKMGSKTVIKYDGERTAKGLWKWIKKNHSKADVIKERIAARKKREGEKGEEL